MLLPAHRIEWPDLAAEKGDEMAKKKSRKLVRAKAPVKRIGAQAENLLIRLRGEAEKLIKRSRSEVLRDIRTVRKELQGRADRAVRAVERQVMVRLHAATTAQVKTLARRIDRLEQEVGQLSDKLASARAA